MSVEIVSVACPGPPPVSSYTWSKSLIPPMIDSIRLIVNAGASSGRTTDQKRRTGPVPSIAAAS
ncbi:hypothetical protein D3C83_166090 [compost metagenome]